MALQVTLIVSPNEEGEVGRITAYSGQGGKTTSWRCPCTGRTLDLFEWSAYRWWPKECCDGGGRS